MFTERTSVSSSFLLPTPLPTFGRLATGAYGLRQLTSTHAHANEAARVAKRVSSCTRQAQSPPAVSLLACRARAAQPSSSAGVRPQPQLGMFALASLIDLMSVTTVSGTPCEPSLSAQGSRRNERTARRTLGGSSRLRGGAEAM